jgi:hypothetical protein
MNSFNRLQVFVTVLHDRTAELRGLSVRRSTRYIPALASDARVGGAR